VSHIDHAARLLSAHSAIMPEPDQTNAIEQPITPPFPAMSEPDTASNFAVLAPAAVLSADIWAEAPGAALLKAIVAPDIYTARADRERAVDLRWVLRDIRGNRTRLSPVSQRDLRTLLVFGLVEMRGDTAVLTNAGLNAIV
jgi:hypothetical protein